jgi:peptidoglycan hydrolase CwlO-like protein
MYRQHQFENLLIQLLSYQTNLERSTPVQLANNKDIEEYNNIITNTQLQQTDATADIETLKSDLVKAQKARDHKLEYDRVAREIMKLNTRDTYNE